MPNFQFCLEHGETRGKAIVFDLPGDWAVEMVAKHVARDLASREITRGILRLAQQVMVLDADDTVVARYPLGDFLQIDGASQTVL